MAQSQSTKTISIIQWIRTSRLPISLIPGLEEDEATLGMHGLGGKLPPIRLRRCFSRQNLKIGALSVKQRAAIVKSRALSVTRW